MDTFSAAALSLDSSAAAASAWCDRVLARVRDATAELSGSIAQAIDNLHKQRRAFTTACIALNTARGKMLELQIETLDAVEKSLLVCARMFALGVDPSLLFLSPPGHSPSSPPLLLLSDTAPCVCVLLSPPPLLPAHNAIGPCVRLYSEPEAQIAKFVRVPRWAHRGKVTTFILSCGEAIRGLVPADVHASVEECTGSEAGWTVSVADVTTSDVDTTIAFEVELAQDCGDAAVVNVSVVGIAYPSLPMQATASAAAIAAVTRQCELVKSKRYRSGSRSYAGEVAKMVELAHAALSHEEVGLCVARTVSRLCRLRDGPSYLSICLAGGVVACLSSALEVHGEGCAEVVTTVCDALQHLTVEPVSADVTVQLETALYPLLSAMRAHPSEEFVQVGVCGTLASLCAASKVGVIQRTIAREGGIPAIFTALDGFMDNDHVQQWGCSALWNVCASIESNKVLAVECGALPRLLRVLSSEGGALPKMEALGALRALCDIPHHQHLMVTSGGLDSIHRVVTRYGDFVNVQSNAAGVLCNVALHPSNWDALTSCGAVRWLLAIHENFPDDVECRGVCTAALANLCGSAEMRAQMAGAAVGVAAIAIAEELSSKPFHVTSACHPHTLTRTYRAGHFCDVCGLDMTCWCYSCDDCSFDVHPTCSAFAPVAADASTRDD